MTDKIQEQKNAFQAFFYHEDEKQIIYLRQALLTSYEQAVAIKIHKIQRYFSFDTGNFRLANFLKCT